MKQPRGIVLGLVIALSAGLRLPLGAQASSAAQLAQRFAGMTAITGYEQAMVDTVLSLLPGAQRDRAGSAVLVLGSGEPRRLAACPLDETGFAVGRVRPDRPARSVVRPAAGGTASHRVRTTGPSAGGRCGEVGPPDAGAWADRPGA